MCGLLSPFVTHIKVDAGGGRKMKHKSAYGTYVYVRKGAAVQPKSKQKVIQQKNQEKLKRQIKKTNNSNPGVLKHHNRIVSTRKTDKQTDKFVSLGNEGQVGRMRGGT